MKLLRFAAIALLSTIPMVACDDDTTTTPPAVVVIVGTIRNALAMAPRAPADRARSLDSETRVRIRAARVAASGKPMNPTYSQVRRVAVAGADLGDTPTTRTKAPTTSATTPTWKPEMASRCEMPASANDSRSSGSRPSFRARMRADATGHVSGKSCLIHVSIRPR